ncbi:MAG TPA: Type 1 glutamine amidotransferase-like domain-containing protein [Ohtaekwangia sp.]
MKGSCVVLIYLILSITAYGQGKVVLVGGGSENEGGWSDLPYAWIVAESANKKVAVISYTDEDEWIPDYFISQGAVEATNIKIDSRSKADLESTYHQLMQYDAFFFKGGDQYNYYQFFKDTWTTKAIQDKFNAGGVIAGTSAGMAILSEVIFTAEIGSVYPDEALQNFNDPQITLANDFLPLFPGFIFDSHFTERGRGARLLGFMTRWFMDTGTLLTGVGVDDRTAFCIDDNKIGIVYGTGSVSIYNSSDFSAYDDDKPVTDSVHVTQLLHGHTFDLTELEILNGPEDPVVPVPQEENGNYQVMLGGSEGLSGNTPLLNFFIQETGTATDTIVVVTAPGKAKSYIQRLEALSVNHVVVETSASANADAEIDMRNVIRDSKKILFAENDDEKLFDFLKDGPTGKLLEQHIRRNDRVVVFIGEDSRYAGSVFVTNHLSDPFAAYYGRLVYRPGLGLLRSSVIMSDTYNQSDDDFYENTTAAVSYAMVADSLKYGIYLNRNSYLRFYQEANRNYFQARGNLSTLLLINAGTNTAFERQPVDGTGSTRQYVGFETMQCVLLNGASRIEVGTPFITPDQPYEYETPVLDTEHDYDAEVLSIFPNPSSEGCFYLSTNIRNLITITLIDFTGRQLWRKVCNGSEHSLLDLTAYPAGPYVVMITSGSKTLIRKISKGGSISR